jgi:hypothetical protein
MWYVEIATATARERSHGPMVNSKLSTKSKERVEPWPMGLFSLPTRKGGARKPARVRAFHCIAI